MRVGNGLLEVPDWTPLWRKVCLSDFGLGIIVHRLGGDIVRCAVPVFELVVLLVLQLIRIQDITVLFHWTGSSGCLFDLGADFWFLFYVRQRSI